jgi:hypothetical protein
MNEPRVNLSESFLYHTKNARCVWERSEKGKWYSRFVEPEDIKRWEETAQRYSEGTYETKEKEVLEGKTKGTRKKVRQS